MKRTMRRSIVIFVSCLLLLCILNVPVLAWEWPCPNECYYWDGDDCIKIKDCGVADPCPDEEHYSCVECECICDADPYYTQHTVIDPVSITSPSNNYVVCTEQTITLTCSLSEDSDIYHRCVDNVWTEDPKPDPVTHTWTAKRDSTDVGTFPNGNTGTSVAWQPPNSAGPVTVKVTATDSPLYDDSLDNPDPTYSITVYVIDDLTVIPREAYVCVSGTKEFAAWRCVDDIATDVTSSATFSTDNTDGSMKRTTGESTGPNNNILHPGSVSASIGDDYVRAVHDGTSTKDTGGDCELTVFDVEILQPSNNDDFDITQNNYTTTPDITFQARILPVDISGNIDWNLDLEYQTSGGYGSGSNHREFQTSNNAEHAETYSGMGGRITINASATIDDSTATDGPIYITVTGTPIPDATITSRLKALYDPEPGGTESICCGIAHYESAGLYAQFSERCDIHPGCDLYGRHDKWPLESAVDGGSHIGLMQMSTTFLRAWSWLTNTSDGVNLYEGNITQSHTHVNNLRAAHPGLRDLTAVEHENNASSIYRTGDYYYRWNGNESEPDWEINTDNMTGVEYADEVRERSELF